MSSFIGIDLGGTRIKAVLMGGNGDLLYRMYVPTNDGDDKLWKNSVNQAVAALKAESREPVPVIGIAAPGLPNNGNTAIACMPGRMQGLEHFEWAEFLHSPAYVINDAIAALIAEARLGSARNRKNVAMVTIGTGVGGAILIDGKPYQGSFNKAGHIGHMCIDDEGKADVTGMPGSLEQCIGNCTIGERSGGRFSSTRDLLDAYALGDSQAKEIWLKSVRQLAIGLSSITNILSPEAIVIGGGIAGAGNLLFDPLREFMEQFEWRANGAQAEILRATYGDMAGAVGAGLFALEKMKS